MSDDPIIAFDNFINEPPAYEAQRLVRDYRHEAARKWIPVRDEVLRLRQQWRDISTAPKDRTPIILSLWNYNGPERGRATLVGRFADGIWVSGDDQVELPTHPPTYWMPLPEPPK